jgi:hypothetical protein
MTSRPRPASPRTTRGIATAQLRAGRAALRDVLSDVGIAPVNNGGLLAAGLFVAARLGLPAPARPRAFLETVAVSNRCKFIVRSRTNRDYIADVPKLTCSLPYVIGELGVLHPAAVLIPQAVWRQPPCRYAATRW